MTDTQQQGTRQERYARADSFWADLVAKREYRTPPGRKSRLVRWMPRLASFHYHAGVTALLVKGGTVARMGRYDELHWAQSGIDIVRAAERSGGRFEITGLRNLESPIEAMVIISNHMSAIETYVMGGLVLPFRDMAFIMKSSLMDYPIIGHLMRALRSIPVTRQNPRQDFTEVLTHGVPILKSGRSIVVFPQSTRAEKFDSRAFNTLGIKLAVHAGVPVLPVAVKSDFLRNGKYFRNVGPVDASRTIHLEFGAPIPIEGKGKAQHETVIRFIEERLRKWGAEIAAQPERTDEG